MSYKLSWQQLLDLNLMMLDKTRPIWEHGRKLVYFTIVISCMRARWCVYLHFWTSELPSHCSWVISWYLCPNTFLPYELFVHMNELEYLRYLFPGRGVTTCGQTGLTWPIEMLFANTLFQIGFTEC